MMYAVYAVVMAPFVWIVKGYRLVRRLQIIVAIVTLTQTTTAGSIAQASGAETANSTPVASVTEITPARWPYLRGQRLLA